MKKKGFILADLVVVSFFLSAIGTLLLGSALIQKKVTETDISAQKNDYLESTLFKIEEDCRQNHTADSTRTTYEYEVEEVMDNYTNFYTGTCELVQDSHTLYKITAESCLISPETDYVEGATNDNTGTCKSGEKYVFIKD